MRTPRSSRVLTIFSLLILMAALAGGASAQDARPIRHQGFLLSDSGRPVTGARDLGFAFYDAASGGDVALWSEAHPGVTVDRGLFAVLLGSIEPLPVALFADNDALWLETSVNGKALEPRVPLTAVPVAVNADALGDVPASGWQRRLTSVCLTGQAIQSIAASGAVRCVEAPVGDPGPEGPQGPPGEGGVLTPGSVTSTELANAAVTTPKIADGAVTTEKIASDFTLEIEQLTGLLGQETGYVLPQVADNTVEIEIAGFLNDRVVIVAGPSSETERINSYWGDGRVRHLPGISHENLFVFEYAGPGESSLQALHESYLLGPPNWDLRAISIIVRDLAQQEVFRWNLFEYGLVSITPGSEGRKRYTFRQTRLPDTFVAFELAGGDFGNNDGQGGAAASVNPATDKRVEIDGINTGVYPALVEVNEQTKTIVLEFDWVEGCCIYDWYHDVVTGRQPIRVVSIIEEAILGDRTSETSRRNYFEAWPYKYENFYGFGQDVKMKARLTVSFDWGEDG